MTGAPSPAADLVVDGGDRACGELLIVLAGQLRSVAAGALVRLVATDPAAVVDIPAWCHLTGHRYLGRGLEPDGRPHYSMQTAASPRSTDPHRPWRADVSSSTITPHPSS
jgi:tRNA 2-thiouridine synthesizing protein A